MPGLDYTDERFVDPEYLEAHRGRTLWPERDPSAGEHAAIMVATCGQYAAIDVPLAELHYLAWRNGVETGQSCQDDDGLAYTVFLGDVSADDFRDLAPSSRAWLWEELEDDDGEPSGEWLATFHLADVPAAVRALRQASGRQGIKTSD